MTKSVYFRNFMTAALTVLVSFTILGGIFSMWSYRVMVQDKRRAMAGTADSAVYAVTAQVVEAMDFDLSSLHLRLLLSILARTSGFDILAADNYGLVVSCSDDELVCEHMGKIVPTDALSVMLSGRRFERTTDLGGVFREMRYVIGRPVRVEIGAASYNLGYIFVSVESVVLAQLWRQFAGIFILIALSVMCLAFMLSLIATKRQSAPLGEMARASRRFARGDFDVRVSVPGRNDELSELTQAFNAMADSLQRSEALRREFIANVSHELKTPMTIIAGFSDGILDGTIPRENEAKYLEVISSETKRLSRLVASMLDMSRLQSADTAEILRRSFDISEVMRITLIGFEGKLGAKRLDVEAELPEEAITVRGDKDAITRVVYNLIDNAVKFAEPGTAIKLALWKQGERAFVSVEDRGETIPPEEMPLIFDRFHKADRARSQNPEGVGLGLYLAKTILDNHNEDIYVASRDGVTRFTFTLRIGGA
jgi:signal transduction histidine kinase